MTLHAHEPVRAVLFDLDDIVAGGRLSADAAEVRAAPGARRAVQALRAAGLQVGVVADAGEPSDPADPVAARLAELVGPFDVWCGCAAHTADAHGAAVRDAADRLHVDPTAMVIVGGATADVAGAHDAGAASILVTDGGTTPTGVESADVVVDSLVDAAALVLHSARR
jgi:D-glycero-D-manno-heptose 1,7-bisphosphate phosphatase